MQERAVVHHGNFFRGHAVAFHGHLLGALAHRDDMVGGLETVALDVVDLVIAVIAAAVKFRGVQMRDEGQSAQAAGGHGGGIGHPVVGVDDVRLLFHVFFQHHGGGGCGEAVHFIHEVVVVAAAEVADFLDVLAVFVEHVGIDAELAEVAAAVGIEICVHRTHEQVGELVGMLLPAYLFHGLFQGAGDGYAGGGAQKGSRGLFFSPHAGQNEGDVHALFREALRYAVAGRPQSAADMRRKFPSKHQNAHMIIPRFVRVRKN